MRMTHVLVAITVAGWLAAAPAPAQDVLYRCESAAGVSIQGTPCPKGVAQRRIAVQRLAEPAPTAPTVAAPAPTAVAPPIPLTPASAMRGPGEPYPLWTCMRADGSTFDSRDGAPGRQWVLDTPADDDASTPPAPASLKALPKGSMVIPIEQTSVASDEPAKDTMPPPAGAAPGKWVADQCVRLETQQACDRFATRRDALRKQIYAAKPSERAIYAPEEQDLTAMLFAACRR